jgi:hypothetical protein
MRFLSAVLSLLVIACTIGCGGGQAIVEGQVTFDGQPVEQGTIVFEPVDGTGAVAGGTIQNGKYRLGAEEQLTPGNKLVRIKAMRTTGKKIKADPPAPDDLMVDEVQQYIPPHYNEQSSLTAQVAAGKGTKDFELRSQP